MPSKAAKQISNRELETERHKSYKRLEKLFVDFDPSRAQHNLALVTHFLDNQDISAGKAYEEQANTVLKQVAEHSGSDSKTIKTSLAKIIRESAFRPKETHAFTFIDLFAGIGGFRLAFESLGGKCVFTSEIDKYACATYQGNFGDMPFGDITTPDPEDESGRPDIKNLVPEDADVLCAGFPCQAFSIAGRKLGFEDTRGTLFFEVAKIIEKKKPAAFFLENVKGLMNHRGGHTLGRILDVLRDDLDYDVSDPKIINAKNFGVPQNRERIFIIGFRKDKKAFDFSYPEGGEGAHEQRVFKDIRESEPVPAKYYLSERYLATLRKHRERHESKGNGFGFQIINDDGIANALVVGGMGRERNLVIDNRQTDLIPTTNIKGNVNREGIRKMTPREWARLQGFPDDFQFPVADVQRYKQLGNSVAVPAIHATAVKLLKSIGLNDAI